MPPLISTKKHASYILFIVSRLNVMRLFEIRNIYLFLFINFTIHSGCLLSPDRVTKFSYFQHFSWLADNNFRRRLYAFLFLPSFRCSRGPFGTKTRTAYYFCSSNIGPCYASMTSDKLCLVIDGDPGDQ